MHWTDTYKTIPYQQEGRDFTGCDCGGLVLLALKTERGVVAEDFANYGPLAFGTSKGKAEAARIIARLLADWPVVQAPQPFDLVRLRIGNAACHVGLFVGEDEFLHIHEGLIFPKVDCLSTCQWKSRFIEFRRHRKLL